MSKSSTKQRVEAFQGWFGSLKIQKNKKKRKQISDETESNQQ